MPIANLKPTAAPVVEPHTPSVHHETYQGIVVENNMVPLDAMQAYVDGMPWTVQYFSQLLGKHNDLREVDEGENPAFQQYQKIADLELRVDSALQSSYDAETSITSVIGSATIVHVVPNVNDYFVAEAGSRQLGLFRVKNVERRTFNRGSVYLIEYSLVENILPTDSRLNDLEAKTVRTYQFSMRRLAEGLSPVLLQSTYARLNKLNVHYYELLGAYFQRFFSRTKMTMLVPGQSTQIYDPRLIEFIWSIVHSSDVEEMRVMKRISIDNEPYLKRPSIWTAITERKLSQLYNAFNRYGLMGRQQFNRSSWLKGAIYWGVEYFVYPNASELEEYVQCDKLPYELAVLSLEGRSWAALPENEEKNTYTQAGEIIPLIHDVLVDDYYVFSEAFYTGGIALSGLEILVRDYLKKETLDLNLLEAVANRYFDWPVLEQFYYGPVLWVLMKSAIRGSYL